MSAADLPAVLAVAEEVHPDFPEDPAVFAERRALYPAGCHVLATGSGIDGYLISHPWHDAAPPALNSLIGALPVPAPCYYLHDLAILPERRGGGAGSAAVALVLDHAAACGFDAIRLIAVNGSLPFWTRHGFQPIRTAPAEKIASYGTDARLMARSITALSRSGLSSTPTP